MNATHRKTIARAVSERTGETYQQALTRVVALTQQLATHLSTQGIALDPAGRQQLIDLLVEQHAEPASSSTGAPAELPGPTATAVARHEPTYSRSVSPGDLITVDLISALNHLGALLSCGVPQHEALRAVAPCSQDPALAASLLGAADAMEHDGAKMDAAFASQPALNHPVLCAYAGAGWRAGVITDSLTRAAKVFENDLRLTAFR